MKQNDKFLTVIVVAIVVLVIFTFALVLLSPDPEYLADDSAEAAVYNYLLALQEEDYARALDFISEEVSNRPEDVAEMEWDIRQNLWRFDPYDDPAITIADSHITGDSATVTVKKTWAEMPFLGAVNSSEFTMRLQLEDEGWKLINGQTHWAEEWGAKDD